MVDHFTVIRQSLALVSLALAVGCTKGDDTAVVADTAPVEQTPTQSEGCETVELRYDGPDAPIVGDQWTLLLWCDDALLTGSAVIRWTPDELGTVDEALFTFGAAVSGTLTMKVGTHQASRDVTVGE